MGKIYRLLLCLGLCVPHCALPQTMDCEQTIAYATEQFNAGHFYAVPAILNNCLKSFSREQKQRAYLLLTQTYLLLDDPIGAERSFLEILAANPEFVADDQVHPIDIVYLSKRFTATPRFSWFVSGGSNVSPVQVILDTDISKDKNEYYTLRAGYNFGAGGEYSYSDHVRVRAELNFLHTSYAAIADDYHHLDRKTFVDNQSWLNAPVYLCYSDNAGAYRPYGYAGFSVSALLSDRGSITLRKLDGFGEDIEMLEDQGPAHDFTRRRNKLNQSVIIGGGVKYKVGLDFVFAELRYSAGLKNVVRADQLYGDHGLDSTSPEWINSATTNWEFGHVDDYFRLDNLAITVGFIRPLYNPRELKRARTKGVLRKIKRKK